MTAWWVFCNVKRAPIHLVSIVYLGTTIVFTLSLVSFATNAILQLHNSSNSVDSVKFLIPWSFKNAIIFTLLHAVFLIYLKVKSKRSLQ